MKKIFRRNEKGEIALISAFMSVLFIMIIAIIIDFGVYFYQCAHVQNAVDATIMAVAEEFTSENESVKNVSEKYLEANGVPLRKYGDGVISTDNGNMTINYGDKVNVILEKRGYVMGDNDIDEDEYLSDGYLKLTVESKSKGLLSGLSNIDFFLVRRSAYAKCNVDFETPKAVRYAIFGTDEHKSNPDQSSVSVVPKARNTQQLIDLFTDVVNGINNAFRINPDYHMDTENISKLTTSADVYSGSKMYFDLRYIDASQLKTTVYNGESGGCICKLRCKDDDFNTYCTVCSKNPAKCLSIYKTDEDLPVEQFDMIDDNLPTFSAQAANSFKATDGDFFRTELYTRDPEYNMPTILAIKVINTLDFRTIHSDVDLRSKFLTACGSVGGTTGYLNECVNISDTDKQKVIDQASNLRFISDAEYDPNGNLITPAQYQLNNQTALIYKNTLEQGNMGLQLASSAVLSGSNNQDAPVNENETVTFYKKEDTNNSAKLQVNYTTTTLNKTNSVFDNTKNGLAIRRTFNYQSDQKTAPDMVPYFYRAINRSIRNATTTKDSNSDASGVSSSAISIKELTVNAAAELQAAKDSQKTFATVKNGDGTFTKGAAEATTNPDEVPNGVASTYVDNTYKDPASLRNVETTPLFRHKINAKTNDEKALKSYSNYNNMDTYTNDSAGHLTYKGENVFENNELRTAKSFVDEYKANNSNRYGMNAVNAFDNNSVKIDADYNDASVHDADVHYGKEAVEKMKDTILNEVVVGDADSEETAFPKKNSVFLAPLYSKKEYMDAQIRNIKTIARSIDNTFTLTVPDDLRTTAVTSSYTKSIFDGYTKKEITGVGSNLSATINKNYNKPNGENVNIDYKYTDLLQSNAKIAQVLAETRADFSVDGLGRPVNSDTAIKTICQNFRNSARPANPATPTGFSSKSNVEKTKSNTNLRFVLENKVEYGTLKPYRKDSLTSPLYRYGIYMPKGYNVVANSVSLDSAWENSAVTLIGYPTNPTTADYRQFDTSTSTDRTYFYVKNEVLCERSCFAIGNYTTMKVGKYMKLDNDNDDLYVGSNSTLIVGANYYGSSNSDGYLKINKGDLLVAENSTVYVNGNIEINNWHHMTVGRNSTVIVEGELKVPQGYVTLAEGAKLYVKSTVSVRALQTAVNSEVYVENGEIQCDQQAETNDDYERNFSFNLFGKLYCGKSIWIDGASGTNNHIFFNTGSQTYLGTDLTTEGKGDIKLYENALVVVNGYNGSSGENLAVRATNGRSFIMESGAVMVTLAPVYHRIDASRIELNAGSLVVTDMIKSGNASLPAYLGNVICKKIDICNLYFRDTSNIFVSDEIYINGGNNITFQGAGKIVVGTNASGQSISGNGRLIFPDNNGGDTQIIRENSGIGTIGTVAGIGSAKFILNNGSFFSVPGSTIDNIQVNSGGAFYVPLSQTAVINTLTINNGAEIFIGNLRAGTLSINGNVDIHEITSVDSLNIDNAGKLVVDTNCTVANASNAGTFEVAGTLTVSNKLENYNLLGVGTKDHNGSLVTTSEGKIINHGIIQALGSVNVRNLTNSTNAYGKATPLVYVTGDLSITGEMNNGTGCQVAVNSLTASGTIVNSAAVEVIGNMVSSNTVTNNGTVTVGGMTTIASLVNGSDFFTNNNLTVTNLTNTGTVNAKSTNITNCSNEEAGVIEVVNNALLGSGENRGTIAVNGDISTNDFTNSGKIDALSNFTTTGTLVNSNKLYVNNVLSASNSIVNNPDGFIYIKGGSYAVLKANAINNNSKILITKGDINVSNSLVCGSNCELLVNNGQIITNNFEVYTGCKFKCSGSITINDSFINSADLALNNIFAKKIQNNGNLYINAGASKVTFSYIYNAPGASIAIDGNSGILTTGTAELEIDSSVNNISLLNDGNIYVDGSLSTAGTIDTRDGEILVLGTVTPSKTVSYESSSVILENGAEFYVYDEIVNNANNDKICIKDTTGTKKAVLSIYNHSDTLLGSYNQVFGSLDMQQRGCTLYVGSNARIVNYFNCKGNAYFYKELTSTSSATFEVATFGGLTTNRANLYVASRLNAPSATLNVKDNANFFYYGNSISLAAFNLDNSGTAKWYKLSTPVSFPVTLNHNSLLYVPNNAFTIPNARRTIYDAPNSKITSDKDAGVDAQSLKSLFDAGLSYISDKDTSITETLTIKEGSTLCVTGVTTIKKGVKITNNGNLYLAGGIKINDNGTIYDISQVNLDDYIEFRGNNSESYIGSSADGTVKFAKFVNTFNNQKVYIDNDVAINGSTYGNTTYSGTNCKSGNNYVPNRGESLVLEGTSRFCVSGTLYTNGYENKRGDAIYIGGGADLSCGGALYVDSSIYNYGKVLVSGELVTYESKDGVELSGCRDYTTDYSPLDQGYSIQNGSSDYPNAQMFFGGKKADGTISTKTINFVGFIKNCGKMNFAQPVWVHGYTIHKTLWMRCVGEDLKTSYATRTTNSHPDYAPHFSVINDPGAELNFGSSFDSHAGLYNRYEVGKPTPVVSCETHYNYGMAIINGGTFYAKGSVGYSSDPYLIQHIEIFWGDGDEKKGSYSIVNGYIYGNRDATTPQNNNAVFYAGGNLRLGTTENESNEKKYGGTIQNWGNMYVDGNVTIYSKDTLSVNKTSLVGEPNSKTFFAGTSWSSGGAAIMKNSMFLCDGDFISKRCLRVGVSEILNGDDDINASCYMYVGGNMVTSAAGTGSAGDLGSIKINTWNYLEIFSNANVFVGGCFYTNSIFTQHKNVTLVVAGENKGAVNAGNTFWSWLGTFVNNMPSIGRGYNSGEFKFVVNDRYNVNKTLREGRTNALMDSLYVRGSAFINGRTRIPDMSQIYVYGDFVTTTTALYTIEVGRAYDVNNDKETWGAMSKFVDPYKDLSRSDRNYDHNYANAPYVYIQGNLDTSSRVSVYPGATLKVAFASTNPATDRKKFNALGSIKVAHDVGLYLNCPLKTTLGSIEIGEHSEVFTTGDMTALTAIVAKEYSTVYSNGDISCLTYFEGKLGSKVYTHGTIKSRLDPLPLTSVTFADKSFLYCEGDIVSLTNIELGEFYNFNDKWHGATAPADTSHDGTCICDVRCSGDEVDGDCTVCSSNSSNCKAPECNCSGSYCSSSNVKTSCPVCKENYRHCTPSGDADPTRICTCSGAACTAANSDCTVCASDYSKCDLRNVDPENTLQNVLDNDPTDKATGGKFYIGGKLCAYTGHIKEFGNSKVIVGKLVFSMDYITLRRNADMWVIPELFGNSTPRTTGDDNDYTGGISITNLFKGNGGAVISSVLDAPLRKIQNIFGAFNIKNGSVYALGGLSTMLTDGAITLNNNASLVGTYDCVTCNRTTLLHDSLVYFGRYFKLAAPAFDASSLNLKCTCGTVNCTAENKNLECKECMQDYRKCGATLAVFNAVGGDGYSTMRCTNKTAHPHGYVMYNRGLIDSTNVKCDVCGQKLDPVTYKTNVTCPVTLYANKGVYINTSSNMRNAFIVSNGKVIITDPFSTSTNDDEVNIRQLPNAIASFSDEIKYTSYSTKICAMFYAPQGNITLDGFEQTVYGTMIGKNVNLRTCKLTLHNFITLDSMRLNVATPTSAHMITQREFESVNDDDIAHYPYNTTEREEQLGGAALFMGEDFFDEHIMNP